MRPSERRQLELLLNQVVDELAPKPASVAAPFVEALERLHQIPVDGE